MKIFTRKKDEYENFKKINEEVITLQIKESLALFERIFDYFDKESEIDDLPNAESMHSVNGLIEFENVSFSYN